MKTELASSYWFLRHGETDWNAQHLSQGRSDIALNKKGLAQATRAGQALAKRFAAGERPFTHIVSSPLSRAYVTAEMVQKEIQEASGVLLPLTIEENLIEVCFGEEEGHPMGSWYDIWIAGEFAPKGGEVFADLRSRAILGVNKACALQEGLPLIVAHGALFRALRNAMGLEANVRLANATPLFIQKTEEGWVLEEETLPPLPAEFGE